MIHLSRDRFQRPKRTCLWRFATLLVTISWGLLFPGTSSVFAQVKSAAEAVEISATWSVDVARPDDQVVLAIVLDVTNGYHIGNAAQLIPDSEKNVVMPTRIDLSIPGKRSESAANVGEANFPNAKTDSRGQQEHNAVQAHTSQIEGQTIVYVPVKVAKTAQPGQLEFDLAITYQACDERACFAPSTFRKKLSLNVASPGTVGQGCPRPELFARWSDRRASSPSNEAAGTDYKSKEPPIGPPWVRELQTAQELALKSGRPIFLYSTKTFCPHCVIVESEMLSSPALKPHYDSAVWLYVYRDFTGGEDDRNAERIGDRYSLSSWPQLWLIDPHDLSVIGETGRTVDSFKKAVSRVNIESTDDLSAVDILKSSESKVIAFDRAPTVDAAKRLIQSDDVVAQISAARFLVNENRLEAITQQAKRLLAVPNDGLRYEVLKTIARTGAGDAALEITQLVENPHPSRNFNVLRSNAIKALGACGDASAVSVIAPHATQTARNSTTRVAVDALMQLVDRHPDCKPEVIAALSNSFPPCENGVERLVHAQAKKVHADLMKLTGRQILFPESYDENSRADLIRTWSEEPPKSE